jgi:alpha-tubulin suppressor-like RCC1 family protein
MSSRWGAGLFHGCARRSDGSLWCWGFNSTGQVGDGTLTTRYAPVRVTALGTSTAAIAVGSYSTCARRVDGKLLCWGSNTAGQLGDGGYVQSKTPRLVLGLQCECGDGVCSRSETKASCPIDCRQASCGDGQCTGSETHTSCARDCAASASYTALSAGTWHACAGRADGSLWCWGKGSIGSSATTWRASPVRVTAFGSGAAPPVEQGTFDSVGCALRPDGSLWCWGKSAVGQVGDGTTATRATPVRLTALGTTVAEVKVGTRHNCARRTDGSLWCWGSNVSGQIGIDPNLTAYSPTPVAALGTTVLQVSVGGSHTCARRTDGSLWCWGSNGEGALGDGTTVSRSAPLPVVALGTSVVEVAAASDMTCARRTDGSLWCWGSGYLGALGDGTTISHFSPAPVTALGTSVAQVRTGGLANVCARRTNGSLWCWGYNGAGQLGDGSTDYATNYYRALPVQVAVLGTSVVDVALGLYHGCARRTDGSVWCWGDNTNAQLGTAATVAPLTSTPVPLAPCGDGICSLPELQSGGCAADCTATCGDCVCDGVLEDAASCPADCVAGNTCTPGTCGNGKCDATENCQLCATDCGTCYPF